MVLLAVVVVVAVVGDEFIVCDVDCECSECDAEAGEGALEAVAGAEGTGVSPGLAVSASVCCYIWTFSRCWSDPDVRSGPRVAGGLACRSSELLRVEASEVGSGSHCDVWRV